MQLLTTVADPVWNMMLWCVRMFTTS